MKTIKTPDSWNEVTISQFQEINTIDNNNTSKSLEIVSVLINEDVEDIRTYDVASLNRILSALSWCEQLPNDKDFIEQITIDNIEYNLVKLSSLSVGEWIDLEGYLSDPIPNLHNIAGLLYRDTYEPYDTDTSAIRAELFKYKVSVCDVYGMVVFFCNIERLSMETIKDYFKAEIQRMTIQTKTQQTKKLGWLKRLRLRSGAGTTTYTA